MFQSRSIMTKMLSTSTLLIVFLVGIGTAGIHALITVSEKYDHVASINLPNNKLLTEMYSESLEISRSYLRMALPGTPAEEIRKRTEAIQKAIESYQKKDLAYRDIPFAAGEHELHADLEREWQSFSKAVEATLPLVLKPQTRGKFQKEVETTLSALRARHGEALTRLIDFQMQESKTWVSAAQAADERYRQLLIVIVLLGVACAITFAVSSARALSKSLRGISGQIDQTGTEVRTASVQLAAASQQLSSGATQAASALEETVASVEELSSMVQLNADHAREASTLSEQSRRAAQEGENEIGKLNEAIHEIAQSSRKIEEIINVIDDIAFQTNLLALNAAVEAARAGEQGKGFAVVAEAVRALAQRSASAAKDISALIKESVLKIERGEKMADASGSVLKNIVSSVSKVASLNNEIAIASQEQSHGLSQISKAMNELDQATQRNATSAEETAASSEEMSSQANGLEILVGHLNAVIEGADKAHERSGMETKGERMKADSRHGDSRGQYAVVKPFKRREKLDEKTILPLDDNEELQRRKVGSINGF